MNAIGLNFGMSPPETCRVEVQPSKCSTGVNSSIKGSQNYTTPQGVTYHQYGMTVSDYNQGLRVPQMRTFLGPEFFNGGCTSLYCKDSTMCPNSVKAQTCAQTQDMFKYLFDSERSFVGNTAPPACFGGKCSGYSSVPGWETSASNPTQLKWQAGSPPTACGASFA
jgi:hypothetical protein